MNDNEKNEVYFGGYGIPEIWTDEPQTISIFESPAISSMAPQKARVAEPPELIPMGRKKARRPVMAVVAAVACSMALMFGSGLAGAKLVEGRLGALSGDVAASQTYNPAADVFDDSGSSDSVVNSLGSVNPDGGTLSLTELFAGANPAVVAISTETTGRNAFGRTVTLPAAGSGFIISEDGYIVTNNHVIEDANSISVLMYNGTKYTAVLVGRDPASDLAVLKIDAKDLSYLTWGNSDALKVGEQVVAIGNPLGEFANSLTVGYISALDREINIDGNPRIMLQTDTAVNNGNSGGPLIDLKGRVIGIVSAKSSGMNVEGLGFAIPSNGAKGIVDLLIKDGYIKGRAVMGVQVGTTMDDNEKTSVYVDSVNSGSAAEKAGVEVGDIILSANGKEVSTVEGLKKIIGALSPGDKLSLKIRRGDEEKLLTVLLDEYKPADPATSAPSDDQLPHREYLPNDGSDMPFDPWSYYPPDMGEMFPKR